LHTTRILVAYNYILLHTIYDDMGRRYKIIRISEETWRQLKEVRSKLGYGATLDMAIRWLLEEVSESRKGGGVR